MILKLGTWFQWVGISVLMLTLPKVGGVGRFSCQRKSFMNLRPQGLIPSPIALCSSYFDNILQIQVKIGKPFFLR